MSDRDDPRERIEQTLQLVHAQLPGVGHGHDAQGRPLFLAQHLPGDDVRVVLHRRQHHLVAGVDIHAAKRLGDKVDRLRGAARENHVANARSANKALHAEARLFIRLGGPLAERVDGTMHVGVVRLIVMANRLDDRAWLLRRCGVVEVDQRLAVHLLLQDRKVRPNALHVKARRPGLYGTGGAHDLS